MLFVYVLTWSFIEPWTWFGYFEILEQNKSAIQNEQESYEIMNMTVVQHHYSTMSKIKGKIFKKKYLYK